MAEQRYLDFLSKLIYDTKHKKMHWRYLDSNKKLYEGMGWTRTSTSYNWLSGNKETIAIDFNSEDSFYAVENGTYIVIYVWGNQPATLHVVPETFKKVVTLNPDEYGEHITRLLNLVQSQFPNAESFIDNFLSKKDN